ncbi:hypothetical protein RND71_015541 [Anisodus tanguticus]|uniref:Uncharacterized protein n=1 Tax=Anisodus tanguticus TaxID=243964 RepID=A0AAE1S5U5_9SOLA|nr:hypothetical protein RND71_015541 [Anisodus tanguticus]
MEYNYKEEKFEARNTSDQNCLWKIKKIWIVCLGLFCITMGGGAILAWWSSKFHPSNKKLWMVPLGLIMLVTPIIICFAVLLDSSNYRGTDHNQTEKLPCDSPQHLEISP